MDLIIKNKIIKSDIKDILYRLRLETNNRYFKTIINRGDYYSITCPNHKDGQESKPSCSIYARRDDDNIEYGTCHCFACGYKARLPKLVGDLFNLDESFGESWLVSNFVNALIVEYSPLEDIDLTKKSEYNILDSSILDQYEYDNPRALDYLLNKRKLSKDVINFFKVGYCKEKDTITFPTWDTHNNLVGIFERSIENKRYYIPSMKNKPIYLLNKVQELNYSTCYIVESQINALTCFSWGFPAIALFGTGSKYLIDKINKSGLRHIILAFDGDAAGEAGRNKFVKNLSNDILVSYVQLPNGKDINDLTKDEFLNLPVIDV